MKYGNDTESLQPNQPETEITQFKLDHQTSNRMFFFSFLGGGGGEEGEVSNATVMNPSAVHGRSLCHKDHSCVCTNLPMY